MALERKSQSRKKNTVTSRDTQASHGSHTVFPPGSPASAVSPLIHRKNILSFQKLIGNRAVQQALRPAGSRAVHISVPLPWTWAGSIPVQRQPAPDVMSDVRKPVRVTVKLSEPAKYKAEVSIRTVDELVDAYSELRSAMMSGERDLLPDEESNLYWKEWQGVEDDVDHYGYHYGAYTDKSQVVTYDEVNQFKTLLAKAEQYGRWGYAEFVRRDKEMQAELASQRKKVAQAEKEAKDALRMQFLGGEGGDVSTAFLWAMIDHMGTFGGVLADASNLPYNRLFGKILPGAISVANVVVNWSSTNPAAYGTSLQGLAAFNNVISLAGLANSTFINPGYFVTAYVGPMLAMITQMLGNLQMRLIKLNDDAAEILGSPLYIGSEPGGKELWNYMVTAVHAGTKADIPGPSGTVYDYFDNFSDRFDQFNQHKYDADLKSYKQGQRTDLPTRPAEMPTESSWLIFSQLDASAFPTWLYYNRSLVWTVLYGSRNPATAKPIP